MTYSVLVLDDDRHVRESLVLGLEDEDFRVLQAESSEQAFEVLEKGGVDLVVVDLRLPGMNSIDFVDCASLRWRDAKFIVYTGSPEFKIPAFLAERSNVCNKVFLKPLPDMELIISELKGGFDRR